MKTLTWTVLILASLISCSSAIVWGFNAIVGGLPYLGVEVLAFALAFYCMRKAENYV